ncbi:MAG TPA: hypothetical protein VF933_27800 [Streptosporangiaceae bacterium]
MFRALVHLGTVIDRAHVLLDPVGSRAGTVAGDLTTEYSRQMLGAAVGIP